MSVRFGISNAVGFGWQRFKEQPGQFIALVIAVLAIIAVPNIAYFIFSAMEYTVLATVLYILSIIVEVYLSVGAYRITLKVADRHEWKISDVFAEAARVLPYIGATLLYMLIAIGGLLLFILPGIYWGVRFSLYPYFIVDKGQGPVEALKSSWAITEGSFWDLVGINAVYVILILLSLIPLGLGLLISVPVSGIMFAFMFRQLEKHPYVPVA